MKPFEMEPMWLTFTGRSIMFPAVYTPHSQFGHTKFSITADAMKILKADADTMDFVAQFLSGPDQDRVHATCIARPEVICSDVPRLVAKLAGIDARNLNRDRIFAECPLVSIGVVPYRYEIPGGSKSGYALMLRKVEISLPHEDVT